MALGLGLVTLNAVAVCGLQLAPGFKSGTAVRRGASARASSPRLVASVADATWTCWMLECRKMSDDGVSAMADVLSQAQKQGNWLRGLEGTVLVESEDTLQILAQGPEARLQSFADWCRSSLSGSGVSVALADRDAPDFCTLLPLTKQFALAGSGSAFESWKARLSLELGEEVSGWSEEAQF